MTVLSNGDETLYGTIRVIPTGKKRCAVHGALPLMPRVYQDVTAWLEAMVARFPDLEAVTCCLDCAPQLWHALASKYE